MGKRKTTAEVPIVLRRSERRMNQQKCIPIESLLNSEPEVAPGTKNNSPFVSDFTQESIYLDKDPFINQDLSQKLDFPAVNPEKAINNQTSHDQNLEFSTVKPEHSINNEIFHNQNLGVSVTKLEQDVSSGMSPRRIPSITAQEPYDAPLISGGNTIVTANVTQMESKCIPFGSSDNVPVVIHNETPVPRKQNAAFVREKRRRPIVRYEELSDFGDLVEDEYVPPVSNKNSTRKKRYVTTKKANTSTTSIITPTTTTSTTSAIVPTDRASSPTICRVIPPTIELAPTTTPSTPIPKTNASNDEDASNPKNVSSAKRTRGRARGAAAKKKTEDSSKEIDETELTDHLVPKSPEIEYDHEALRFLLQNQTSYLATAELKTMIPEFISKLPQEDLNELTKLLPYTDKASDGSFSPSFASASNNFFWEATTKWQDVLYLGGFDEKKLANKKGKGKAREDTSFKDENYEVYWGERLKRDRIKKERNAKKSTTKKRR